VRTRDDEESDYLYSARARLVVEKRFRAILSAGFDGVVCSAQELDIIERLDPDHALGRLVPGTRLPGASAHDQARVMTPRDAVERGADLLVFGRPIWDHPDGPKVGVETLLEHLA
jgi:orotidine-5'-phosphate decarboxylase